jgi:hypothetical protein
VHVSIHLETAEDPLLESTVNLLSVNRTRLRRRRKRRLSFTFADTFWAGPMPPGPAPGLGLPSDPPRAQDSLAQLTPRPPAGVCKPEMEPFFLTPLSSPAARAPRPVSPRTCPPTAAPAARAPPAAGRARRHRPARSGIDPSTGVCGTVRSPERRTRGSPPWPGGCGRQRRSGRQGSLATSSRASLARRSIPRRKSAGLSPERGRPGS